MKKKKKKKKKKKIEKKKKKKKKKKNGKDPQRISNLNCFMSNWDWKEINFPTQINECKKS